VVDGLDARNNKGKVNSTVVAAHATTILLISGLDKNIKYKCYLTACNNYAFSPTCMEYIEGESALLSMYREIIESNESDGSEWILLGVTALIALFN